MASIPGVADLIDLDTPDDIAIGALEAIWVPFFQNAIVEVEQVASAEPIVMYYNPLLDVAMLASWQFMPEVGYQIHAMRVTPGERLLDRRADVDPVPAWITGTGDIGFELAQTATRRLAEFHTASSALKDWSASSEEGYDRARYDFLAAEPRLVWNVAQRAAWSREPWLETALAKIQAALASRDSDAIATYAPDTDVAVAYALSNMAEGLAEHLVLDMVIGGDDRSHLLIGSTPEDGTVFVLVLCRLSGKSCELSEFETISVDLRE